MITLTEEERGTLNDHEEAILQRAHDATPGPWEWERDVPYLLKEVIRLRLELAEVVK